MQPLCYALEAGQYASASENKRGKCWKPPYWCRSGSSINEGLSPSCWRYIAAARLLMARATVAKLAFAIPECPEQLLVCLQHALARGATSRSKDVKPQYDRQYDISKDVKVVLWAAGAKQPQSMDSAGKQKHSKGAASKHPSKIRQLARKGYQETKTT